MRRFRAGFAAVAVATALPVLSGCPDLLDEDAAVVLLTEDGEIVGVADGGGSTVWSTSYGGGSHGDLLADGGTIYALVGGSTVVAVDGVDGGELWSVDLGSTGSGELAISGDTLFAQTLDRVVGLDAGSGEERFSEPYSGLSGAMAVGGGALVCGGDPVRRLDPDDGSELASFATGNAQVTDLGVTGGRVIVGGWDAVWSLMPETLDEDWTHPLDNASASGVAVDGGEAFVATDNDGLLGFAANDGAPFMDALAGLPLDVPVASDGVVYVTESYGDLYAVDAADGSELWSTGTGNDRSGGIRVLGGTVYLADGDALVGIDGGSGVSDWEFASGGTILALDLL